MRTWNQAQKWPEPQRRGTSGGASFNCGPRPSFTGNATSESLRFSSRRRLQVNASSVAIAVLPSKKALNPEHLKYIGPFQCHIIRSLDEKMAGYRVTAESIKTARQLYRYLMRTCEDLPEKPMQVHYKHYVRQVIQSDHSVSTLLQDSSFRFVNSNICLFSSVQ